MISRSRRDSVGGVGGGGSSRFFPSSPEADQIRWGGGVVAGIFFSDLHKRNGMFTPH